MEYNQNELTHYGVKGMKWGHRKAQHLENRVARKYGRAGRARGSADYQRQMGAEEYKKHESSAKVLDKVAKKQEKSGNYIRAEASRRAAAAIRARGANVKNQRDEAAAWLDKRADRLQEKASTFATKKRVDLGKKKVESILSSNRKKGFEESKLSEELHREWELEDRLGPDGYEAYKRMKGNI